MTTWAVRHDRTTAGLTVIKLDLAYLPAGKFLFPCSLAPRLQVGVCVPSVILVANHA